MKTTTTVEYYTQSELEQAQSKDIVSYLNEMGYKLKKEGHFYRGVSHNSMVINGNNGRWNWNSKDLHGSKPVELIKQILMNDFGYDEKSAYINAVKRLAGTEGQNLKPDNQDYYYSQSKGYDKYYENEKKGKLVLPERNENCNRVVAYLCKTRCLDYGIIKELILKRKLYETKDKHNACFVAYDNDNIPKHAFMRGTLTNKNGFKQDVSNSDKSYGFTLKGNPRSNKVYCFESAIDAISHATLYKLSDMDYKDAHRLCLNGISFLALNKFLEENPLIEEIVSCLDNDETGIKHSKKLCKEFSEQGYKTFIQRPEEKDYNAQLQKFILDRQELELEDEMEID